MLSQRVKCSICGQAMDLGCIRTPDDELFDKDRFCPVCRKAVRDAQEQAIKLFAEKEHPGHDIDTARMGEVGEGTITRAAWCNTCQTWLKCDVKLDEVFASPDGTVVPEFVQFTPPMIRGQS